MFAIYLIQASMYPVRYIHEALEMLSFYLALTVYQSGKHITKIYSRLNSSGMDDDNFFQSRFFNI